MTGRKPVIIDNGKRIMFQTRGMFQLLKGTKLSNTIQFPKLHFFFIYNKRMSYVLVIYTLCIPQESPREVEMRALVSSQFASNRAFLMTYFSIGRGIQGWVTNWYKRANSLQHIVATIELEGLHFCPNYSIVAITKLFVGPHSRLGNLSAIRYYHFIHS
jgi:hypothetical protein